MQVLIKTKRASWHLSAEKTIYEVQLKEKKPVRRVMQRPAELSVFQSKVRPKGAGLQKQKSLTNLSLTSEGERRPTVRISNWFGNAAKASQRESSYAERRSLSRFLSRSVQSLYHTSGPGAWNLLPANRAGTESLEEWSSRKFLEGESDEDSRSEDENVSPRPGSTGRGWAEEEGESCLREGTALLDEDVILTMLGDLEQALYTDLLGKSGLLLKRRMEFSEAASLPKPNSFCSSD